MIQTALDPTLETYFMDMLKRIKMGERYTARISCCSLIVPLVKMYPARQDELFEFNHFLLLFYVYFKNI